MQTGLWGFSTREYQLAEEPAWDRQQMRRERERERDERERER